MFEKSRADLASRLGILCDRFDSIERRSSVQLDDLDFARRAGMPIGDAPAFLEEIATKSREQGDLCHEAIASLLVDGAFPFIFRRSVRKAEQFADQCEQALSAMDSAQQAARQVAQQRLGITPNPSPEGEGLQ